MNIGVLQHAAFEGPGEIARWAEQHGHAIRMSHLYVDPTMPRLEEFDLLVVMGGEMNIYQYRDYPWLKPERELIGKALAAGKRVVGICLGSQLIADALGARVTQNDEYELGWFPLTFTQESRRVFSGLPPVATVLHWHGDTFRLPEGATRLAASAGCPEQGYVIPGRCLGLQFHLEVDLDLARQMVTGCAENWWRGRFVQTPDALLAEAPSHTEANRRLLFGMLDVFCA